MHEFALTLTTLLAAGPGLDPTVQVALVGGVFGLAGVALSVLVDKGGRRNRTPIAPADDDDAEALAAERLERAIKAEAQLETATRSLLDSAVRERRYREFILGKGYDPDTFRRRRAMREEEA